MMPPQLSLRPLCEDFVVFDTETTGTSAAKDRIVELAAVRVSGGEVVARLQTLIYHPELTVMPARAFDCHGITLEMCRAYGLPEREALRLLWLFAGSSVMVAHNAAFDVRMISAAYTRLSEGKMSFTNPVLCSLTAARERYPQARNHQLGTLVEILGVERREAHRALGDVLMTADVLNRMLAAGPLEHLINRLGVPAWVKGTPEPLPAHLETVKQ